jgi:hypothetical protein
MSATLTNLDPRMLKIVVAIGSTAYTYEDTGSSLGFGMTARGTKYANAIQNECEVEIFNLSADEKNYIVTETSPFNKNTDAKTITVYAGRVSTGYSQVFTGDITNATIKPPPDVALTLKSATGQALKRIVGSSISLKQVKLSAVAGNVAASLGLQLNFQATDKLVSGYAFSGSQLKQVDKIGDLGPVSAYVDDNNLVVKNINLPLADELTYVNLNTGMIDVPEVTEEGVEVKFLFNNNTKLGGAVQLESVINPSCNGSYTIFKLAFDLSNRDTNFYYTATCVNNQYSGVNIGGDDGSDALGNDPDDGSDDDGSDDDGT